MFSFSASSAMAGTCLRGVPLPFYLKPYFFWKRMKRMRHVALLMLRDLAAASWSTCSEVLVSIIDGTAVMYQVADNQPLGHSGG